MWFQDFITLCICCYNFLMWALRCSRYKNYSHDSNSSCRVLCLRFTTQHIGALSLRLLPLSEPGKVDIITDNER